MMNYFQPSLYLEMVAKLKLDSLMLIPTMYSLLLKGHPLLNTLSFASVKYCYIGAEACPESLIEKIKSRFNAVAVSTYGATECLSGLGYTLKERETGCIKKGSCGRHLYGEVKLMDERNQVSPEIGELFVKNNTVEECYLDDSLNKSKFIQGWYKTGDIFYKDCDGFYFWKGRVDDMFICKGNNVYPIEIEKILQKFTSVKAVCVSPIMDNSDNTILAVLVVKNVDMSEGELVRYLLKNGPAYAIPQFVLFVDRIPTVGIGKMDRRVISTMLKNAYQEKNRFQCQVE